MGKSKTRPGDTGKKDIPMVEWIAASLGVGMVFFILVFLLLEANEKPDQPPDITINIIRVTHGKTHYTMLINVNNSGFQTAEGVIISGELLRKDSVIESSRTMFDYLPGESKREGGLMFLNDPQKYELRIKALGFEKP